jgi:hypothetical protein
MRDLEPNRSWTNHRIKPNDVVDGPCTRDRIVGRIANPSYEMTPTLPPGTRLDSDRIF